MKNIMEGATITGLMALGSLVGSWLNIKTPLAYTIQEKTIALQDILDQILPKMLPLAVTLIIFYLFRKNISTMWLLIITAVFFFVFGALGVFG
jgi:mannose/fructose/N-acetylgalactosamine-specific phosphotransferase system component IID